MARKGWGQLSDTYRRRLERNGVSRQDYESGISLAGARGHAATPERPERAETKPEQYQEYIFKRDQLVDQIMEIKRAAFGQSGKWNEKRAKKAVTHHPKGKVRSQASLNRVWKAIRNTDDLYTTMVDLEDDDKDALYYH